MARYASTSQQHTAVRLAVLTRCFTRADFLLFIPTHSPGLKAVFSYYSTTVKLSSEGDVNMSDEALAGLGTAFSFFKTSMFGAILQLIRPSPPSDPTASSTAERHDADNTIDAGSHPRHDRTTYHPIFDHGEDDIAVEDDPYIPVKPARRKGDPDAPTIELKLTDLVPDVGYFVAGGLSGITSRTATAPLDRLKVYLIAQTGNASEVVQAAKQGQAIKATAQGAATLANAVRELWAAGGIRSLFAGMFSCVEF